MRWLVAAALGLGLLVAAAAIARLRAGEVPLAAAPAVAAPPRACADAQALPPRPTPDAWAGPLLVLPQAGAEVELDGAAPGPWLRPGRHVVVARAPGAAAARLEVDVEPFAPVLVEARLVEGAVTVLVLGARCASCTRPDGPVDLGPAPGATGSRAEVSLALSSGDVARAARAFRALPGGERETPEPRRLAAVLWALSGQAERARSELERLPRDDGLHAQLAALARHEAAVPARQEATAVARWNGLTDGYQRLSDALAADAPEVVSRFSARFQGLSGRFQRALEAHRDGAVEREASLDEALATLEQFALTLRRSRPGACDFQARLTAVMGGAGSEGARAPDEAR